MFICSCVYVLFRCRRLPGERVHLWVLSHHPGSPERWGGLDDLDEEVRLPAK